MFWTVSLLHELRSKTCWTGSINAQVCATKSHRNFSQRTLPIYPIGPQAHVLGRNGLVCYCTNFGAKHAKILELTLKFVQRSRVGIFRNKRTRSTLLDSNSYFVVFRTVSLLLQLRCKTGRTGAISALVRATKSRRNFSQWTHPMHPIGPQTHVLRHFRPFHYCTDFSAKQAKLVRLMQ
jgi:hypothetical protein